VTGSTRAGTSRAARGAAIPGASTSSATSAGYGTPAGGAVPVGGAAAVMGAEALAFARPGRSRRGGDERGRQSRPPARPVERLYDQELPDTVRSAFFTAARTPIGRAEPMYKDIASQTGISWKLLATCDWMQCQAQPHLSPVHGERLGTLNGDGTVYSTKSAALAQCATDLIELTFAVYGIDLTVPRRMSVQELADAFAAFRWGGLLRRHRVSSLEFPYSVEGLTEGHMRMRWPAISEPNAPDRPGAKFRMPFGAVPVVLSLNYRATI
jgi:hypothetical protein